MESGLAFTLTATRSYRQPDEVAERALQFQGFGGEGMGGFDSAGVFLAPSLNLSGGQRLFPSPDNLGVKEPFGLESYLFSPG